LDAAAGDPLLRRAFKYSCVLGEGGVTTLTPPLVS